MDILLVITVMLAILISFTVGVLSTFFVLKNKHTKELNTLEQTKISEFATAAAAATENQQLAVATAVERANLKAAQEALTVKEQLAAKNADVTRLEQQLSTLKDELHARDNLAAADQKVLNQLSPVAKNLETLQARVNSLEEQRAKQHGELLAHLRKSAQSEAQMLGAAQSLANALQSGNTRGSWGETTLRRLVEMSGMQEHVNFAEQTQLIGDNRGRPDMVIHLPGGRAIAVDAKAPMSALLKQQTVQNPQSPDTVTNNKTADSDTASATLINSPSKQAKAEHARALKKHIDTLAQRDYASGLGDSLDMVIAFVPNEALLAQALEADPGLLEYSLSKNVAMASPVSFWAVLKAVEHNWRQAAIGAKAKEVFDLGNELYKRLGTMSNHLDKLGRAIASAGETYNKFLGSYESSVLASARKIKKIDPNLLTPQIEDVVEKQVNFVQRDFKSKELTTAHNAQKQIENNKQDFAQ